MSDIYSYFESVATRFLAAEEHRRAARAARLAEAALTLAEAARGEYACAKRARGVLDYDDLIVETLHLLERATRRRGCSTSSTAASTIS